MTAIEYTLIAGLAAAALVGAGPPLLQALQAPLEEAASALAPHAGCQGGLCVEPAAGTAPPERRRRH